MWNNCFYWGGTPFFPLLIIFIIAYLVYSLFSKDKNRQVPMENDSISKTLNTRYVKGEIDKDEYETIKKDIL
jgi:uncharacterized membrane protein